MSVCTYYVSFWLIIYIEMQVGNDGSNIISISTLLIVISSLNITILCYLVLRCICSLYICILIFCGFYVAFIYQIEWYHLRRKPPTTNKIYMRLSEFKQYDKLYVKLKQYFVYTYFIYFVYCRWFATKVVPLNLVNKYNAETAKEQCTKYTVKFKCYINIMLSFNYLCVFAFGNAL